MADHPGTELPDEGRDDDEAAAPAREPKSSRGWLATIAEAERAARPYHDRVDTVEKQFANLDRLASVGRDRQFQMFWANMQVLGPSIYSRPPIPVVVPRFQDRRALQRAASEVLERSAVVTFEREDVDGAMRLVRDNLNIGARGCLWLRYETRRESDTETERVRIEWVHRRDFLHSPDRSWSEVGWVARGAWLTRAQMRKRFAKTSGKLYQSAAYSARRDDDGLDDRRRKARVWEVWSKDENRVVWVSEGCDRLLDDGEPHLTLEGFFPCPRPAYGTLEPGTLTPVPEFAFYKDQLEEINELTGRIAVLSTAVRVRAFYPAGAGEIADALEAAIKSTSDNAVFVPISNWNLVGSGKAADMLIWLPIQQIVSAIKELIEQRRQLIDDVYQITGLSDIMRGATEASETLGAQQLKSQYGSIRIRDRQMELVRVARDATRIACEIMSENFAPATLLAMAQIEMPTQAAIQAQAEPLLLERQTIMRAGAQAVQSPQVAAMAQQAPDQAQAVAQQAHARLEEIARQLADLARQPTVEGLRDLLRDQRLRPFALDIETDSTITPDENAQKQRATEYVTAMGGFLAQALPQLQQFPQAAPFVAQTFKFIQGQFRVGRQMDQVVDELVDKMQALAEQGSPPDPNAAKSQADADAAKNDGQIRLVEAQTRAQESHEKSQRAAMEIEERRLDLATKVRLADHEFQASQAESAAKLATMSRQSQRDDEQHQQSLEIQRLTAQRLGLQIQHLAQRRLSDAMDAAGIANAEIA